MQTFSTQHIVFKSTYMNELITALPIYKAMNKFNFRIFFKGIWAGVLISLIVHSLANN